MILNLRTPITQTESAANVSVATRCVDVDLNEETNLFAVGFAQSEGKERSLHTCSKPSVIIFIFRYVSLQLI